ncbi:MAG TPA: 4-(cytidine 5'-diphospho)-2-C-methyl-D-erythritol kinase [Allosphingosinicella sp.]|jgi:4-diphosphocytidyl-2-C-methyl-D-erythritol kinase|nr:4-(cytidine 5'-diphospho)-2-C-methyl-D-erythritol kinase [Allosphingosinicella sp.]
MRETAYAKINLALHVRERRPDFYHRIETIFAFCEDGDVLSVEASEGLSLSLEGPFATALAVDDDNLVLQAARALAGRYSVTKGAHLILDKRLPVASGVGGGSADAAAALRLLVRFWGIKAPEEDLLAIAAKLGADVPACLLSRTMRGDGRGDALAPWGGHGFAGTPLLLVNPGVAVSTRDVFARWDGVDRGALPDDHTDGRNDLEAPALAIAPVIADVLAALRQCGGARLVRMSGSGATCFALFESEAARDGAAAAIRDTHPDWWQLASRLRP